jgi:hypothetical protein
MGSHTPRSGHGSRIPDVFLHSGSLSFPSEQGHIIPNRFAVANGIRFPNGSGFTFLRGEGPSPEGGCELQMW